MRKLKRYDLRKIWKENPALQRQMHCEGVVIIMAREDIDVNIDDVYKYYDEVIVPNRSNPKTKH